MGLDGWVLKGWVNGWADEWEKQVRMSRKGAPDTIKTARIPKIPFKTVRVHDPCFDRECRISKCLKKSLERIYMRTKSENDFAAWMGQKKLYKRVCRHKRRDYWNNKLSDPKTKRLKFGATLIVSLVKEKQSNAATFRELNYFITNIRNSEFQIVNKIKII